jgi:Ca2+-binding EF-hand superfamily protein
MVRVRPVAIAMLVLFATMSVAEAQQRQSAARPAALEKSRSMPDKYDADGDGTITRAEFFAYRERRFAALDRDRSGAVSRAEFGLRGRSVQTRATRRDGEFRSLDANSDGAIGRTEWLAAADARFLKLAKDRGSISAGRPSRAARKGTSAVR